MAATFAQAVVDRARLTPGLDALPSPCLLFDKMGRHHWGNRAWHSTFGEKAAAGIVERLSDMLLRQDEHWLRQEILVGHDRLRWTAQLSPLQDEEAEEPAWLALLVPAPPASLAEHHQQTLLILGERLRQMDEAPEILREAVELLGLQLGADRVGYAEMDLATDTLAVNIDWIGERLGSIVGRYPLSSFGTKNIAALASGRTVSIDDSLADPLVTTENRPAFDAMGIRAAITVPLVKRDLLIAVLSVQHSEARRWTASDVRLVEEVAERTWATLERASAEALLRKSEERLRIALDGAELGTWDYDLVTLDGWWSPRTCEIFGIPYQEVIPPELRFTFIHPDDRDRYLQEVDAAAFAGKPFAIEYRIVRPDGEQRWVVLRGLVTSDPEGRPVRASGITIDITDRKRTEEELARSREALHQSEKLTALGSLLAGVAHELNNPLAVAVAHAGLLEEQAVGTPQADSARRIRRAAERCASIVQTFLAMARQQPPQHRPLDVEALIWSALDLSEHGFKATGVTVKVDVEPDLPPVLADEVQMQHVFANLLLNAQQAMSEGEAERRLTITGRQAENDILLLFEDTGCGIEPAVAHRIFEPFFTTKSLGAGTGVGLPFSLGVVEANGGKLWLAETSPGGSTFALSLPIAQPQDDDE